MAEAPPTAPSVGGAGGGGPWAWAAALPEWVRAKGWTARSYRWVWEGRGGGSRNRMKRWVCRWMRA